jgi:hypothetical protein
MNPKHFGLTVPLLLALAAPANADNSQGPFQAVKPGALSPPVELVIPNGSGGTAPPSAALPLPVGGTVAINTLANINGSGAVTRPANTTAYTGGQLIANNTGGTDHRYRHQCRHRQDHRGLRRDQLYRCLGAADAILAPVLECGHHRREPQRPVGLCRPLRGRHHQRLLPRHADLRVVAEDQ